jgi:twinkle protein
LDRDLDWFYFRGGELTVWTGYNGHGKSLMLSQVLLGLMQQEKRCMVFSGEMTPERQLKRLVKQATGLDRPTLQYIDAVGRWVHDRMWLFNVVGSATIARLLDVFQYAHRRYGIEHFVIDSLMMTDVPEDGPGSMSLQKDAIRKMCDFAKRNGVHMHLVAHPRKGADESRGPGKLDVAGSSKITDGADNVFTVWSARKDEADDIDPDKPDAKLELHKQRNGDVQHYTQLLYFCKEAQQFTSGRRRTPVQYVQFAEEVEF